METIVVAGETIEVSSIESFERRWEQELNPDPKTIWDRWRRGKWIRTRVQLKDGRWLSDIVINPNWKP